MSLNSAFPAMVGGFASTLIAEYIGFSNPLIGILGASVGASVLNKMQDFYTANSDDLPGSEKIRNMSNSLNSFIGIKFNTVIVQRNENIIFNKLEKYILDKYNNLLVKSYLSKSDNVNISFNLDNCVFSRPIIDHYNGQRIYFTIKNSNCIHVRSRTLTIEQIKEYIKQVMNMRIGVRTIVIHQPDIQAQISIKKIDIDNNKQLSNSIISWNSFSIQTNKNFTNTILTEKVHKELLQDIENFTLSEDYYNKKGIPYKRGYLLYGVPGTGKTSIIKALASHYGMDIYLINLGDISTERDLIRIFQGTRDNNGYHIICFEDIDRCPFLQKNYYNERTTENHSLIRTFLNELDGVVETPKRITFLTVNDKSVIDSIPALSRPGRIDRHIELTYCDAKQLCQLYNHFTDSNDTLELDTLNLDITPAQAVKHILNNTQMNAEEFKKDLRIVSRIEVSERSLAQSINSNKKDVRRVDNSVIGRKKRLITRRKRLIKMDKTALTNLPKKIEKNIKMLEKEEQSLQKSIEMEKKKKERLKRKAIKSRGRPNKRCRTK